MSLVSSAFSHVGLKPRVRVTHLLSDGVVVYNLLRQWQYLVSWLSHYLCPSQAVQRWRPGRSVDMRARLLGQLESTNDGLYVSDEIRHSRSYNYLGGNTYTLEQAVC